MRAYVFEMIAMMGHTGNLMCSSTPCTACAFKRNDGISEALPSGAIHHRDLGEAVVLIASIMFSVVVSLLCVCMS
jgi:hypothetical protein